ncbi:uncharacterized protein M6B38_138795 [Iris pallida]|uniref:Uncharacterized protein n=1 Tax=Iris pallida TaxID=29817 RepID=A0AAX6FEY7_IRIPA|nr:uncharacterized protein M6B38_138795 [Iris pallida]
MKASISFTRSRTSFIPMDPPHLLLLRAFASSSSSSSQILTRLSSSSSSSFSVDLDSCSSSSSSSSLVLDHSVSDGLSGCAADYRVGEAGGGDTLDEVGDVGDLACH